jgi:N-acetyl-gamma-glutamyl-phosphate/LysW-gamma-L-alpha-aminoadipyl-6-phosphate reductase
MAAVGTSSKAKVKRVVRPALPRIVRTVAPKVVATGTHGPIPLVIFGARSYTAGELLRLLVGHPVFRPALLVSKSAPGATADSLQPHVAGFFRDAVVCDEDAAITWLRGAGGVEGAKAEPGAAAIVLCTGSGESAGIVAKLDAAGVLGGGRAVVDLSGDFRLESAGEYEKWYEKKHPCADLLESFDYCIPELHRGASKSRRVANPGCFATAVQLALAPALMSGGVDAADIRVSAVTGSSGSGATPKPNTHHPFRAHEFYAYKPLAHQHLPEIVRGLKGLGGFGAAPGVGSGPQSPLALVTHSAPLVRGISVTAFFRLKADGDATSTTASAERFRAAYRDFCAREPMLRHGNTPPGLAGVIGTNLAALATSVDGANAVAFCAVDNLCRGASGQALQNLNRIHGHAEETGLLLPGLSPM